MTESAVQMNETKSLPDGWRWVKLGEVCEIIMGQSPPGHTYNRDGKGLPFLQGGVDFGDLYPTPSTWCLKPQKVAQPGDILICVRAPVGPTNLCNEKYCIGRGLAAIRPRDNVDTWFILYYLRLAEKQLADIGRGSTFDAVKREHLEKTLIPLPPTKEEQRRIAGKIQELMAEVERARATCEAQLEAAKALPKAYLRQVFESEEAKKWERRRLEEILTLRDSGLWGYENPQNGVLTIRSVNFGNDGHVSTDNIVRIEPNTQNPDSKKLEKGDILLERSGGGPKQPVGRVVLFDLDGEFYFGNFISRLRCKSEIEPEFVFYQLFFLHLKGLTLSLQDQTTGIRNLRFSEYLKLPILVPALDIQRHIVAELSEKMAGAERLKATIEKQLETIKALPQAILRKAFSGEL
jgi:type I restriction enzyme S subunit